ncbi:MAG: GAF domain-containing protein [Verrucomicrobiaceae bacterium]|nr:GAF domain-containing protein [Verrucomicrobiaceae bacterium]
MTERIFSAMMKDKRAPAKHRAKNLLHVAPGRRYSPRTSMPSPFPSLPDPELASLAARLADSRETWLLHALKDHTAALLDGLPSTLMHNALRSIQADEGSVWLTPDGGHTLTPCWNNGPQAARFVGHFSMPASEGLTGLVFTSSMGSSESEVCFNQQQNRALDESLGVFTWAMLAVPLRLGGQVCGVITAVRLIRRADLGGLQRVPGSREDFPAGFTPPPSFSVADLQAMETTATALGRLLDHRLNCWLMRVEE